MTHTIKKKINKYINGWKIKGYQEDIPDEAPSLLEDNGRIPSYRLIVKALLKNDNCLLTLGYDRPRCELYNRIKREELKVKGKRIWKSRQKEMF